MQGLWKHQTDAIEYVMSRLFSLLWVGMGCGKTRIALECVHRVIESLGGRGRILVGCPRAVMPAWAKQAAMWLPGVRVLVLNKGTAKQKEAQIVAALADTSPIIIVGNYETLWRIPALEKLQWDMLIWDEVHRLKSPSGAASRWAARVCKRNPTAKRLGMSGTLLSHSPLDGWGVYRSVESPECPTWGASNTLYKARYFQPHPHIRGAILGLRRDMEAEFARKIRETTFHRKSEDVLDLPEIMFEDIAVELLPVEARLYREIEQDFCAVCEAGTVTVDHAMHVVLRLQQICGGFVRYDDAEKATSIEETPSKQAALEEQLDCLDADEPVVVFCRFRTDIDSVLAAAKRVGRTASELSGRIDDLAKWQAGHSNLLVAQIASGGIGVDLTRAAYGFFYSLGYSLSEYLQAVARLHRPGQTKTTRFYHLVATVHGRQTVDGRVYDALSKRQEVIDAVIEGYKRRNQGHSRHNA